MAQAPRPASDGDLNAQDEARLHGRLLAGDRTASADLAVAHYDALVSSLREMFPAVEKRRPGSFESATRAHIHNFMEAVRSRQDPSANVEMGQQTSVVLAMAIEALRSGRRVKWNVAGKKIEV